MSYWREMEDLPEGEGTYIVWMNKPQRGGSHIAIMYRVKISNGYLNIINDTFAFDKSSKPIRWQPTPVAPNNQD